MINDYFENRLASLKTKANIISNSLQAVLDEIEEVQEEYDTLLAKQLEDEQRAMNAEYERSV